MWSNCGEAFELRASESCWPRPAWWPPVSPAVLAAMQQVGEIGGNPSSVHRLGQRARSAVERAEQQLLEAFGLGTGEFAYTSELDQADGACIDAALRERVGPKGGCVWFAGEALAWRTAARALVALRGGVLSAIDAGLPSSLAPLWQWSAQPQSAESLPDVLALDLFSPTSGEAALPLYEHLLPLAKNAHLHVRCGALGAPYNAERWPLPEGAAHSLSVASESCGGPAGLAVAVALRAGLQLPPQGTIPRELVTGLGAAAAELAPPPTGARNMAASPLHERACALHEAAGMPAPGHAPRLSKLVCLSFPDKADASGIVMPPLGCNVAMGRSEQGQRVMRVWLWPNVDDALAKRAAAATRV